MKTLIAMQVFRRAEEHTWPSCTTKVPMLMEADSSTMAQTIIILIRISGPYKEKIKREG
jgi:hypothetical protein